MAPSLQILRPMQILLWSTLGLLISSFAFAHGVAEGDANFLQSKQGLQLLNAVNAARVAELDRQNARRSEIATQMADVPKGMVFGSNAGNQVKRMPQFLVFISICFNLHRY